jgi:hypothetical protein
MEADPVFFGRLSLPSRVVVHRCTLDAGALADLAARGEFVPGGAGTCELEVGGQVVARGRMVRKGGRHFFRVTETYQGGAS